MAIKLIVVGKTKESFYCESENEYLKRLKKYCKLSYITLTSSKNTTNKNASLEQEEKGILKHISSSDYLILLDEKGKSFSSRKFAENLNHLLINQANIVFVIGGAFGFSKAVRAKAKSTIQLSSLTFPHHLVRTIFLEQLYRAFTILNGELYHND